MGVTLNYYDEHGQLIRTDESDFAVRAIPREAVWVKVDCDNQD